LLLVLLLSIIIQNFDLFVSKTSVLLTIEEIVCGYMVFGPSYTQHSLVLLNLINLVSYTMSYFVILHVSSTMAHYQE
jgi:hypothetical protein